MRGTFYLLLAVCVGVAVAVPSSQLTPNDQSKVFMKRDYKAPLPPSVDPPAESYPPTDNGYYYYYYPVEEDGKKIAKEKDECSIKKVVAPLIVIAVFLGIIAASTVGLIPQITFPPIVLPILPNGRNMASAAYEYVPWDSLEKLTMVVSEAIESEECLSRLVCESGRYVEGRTTMLGFLEFFMPPRYQNRMKIFKDSALKKSDCKAFKCSYAQ